MLFCKNTTVISTSARQLFQHIDILLKKETAFLLAEILNQQCSSILYSLSNRETIALKLPHNSFELRCIVLLNKIFNSRWFPACLRFFELSIHSDKIMSSSVVSPRNVTSREGNYGNLSCSWRP